VIEVSQLTKAYGPVRAISDLTFKVEKGEVLGFLGPNGAGKTTTMRILTGYMPPTAGTATVAGYDVYKQSMEVRKRIGYLPESPPLYLEMTVASYLAFVARIKGVPSSQRKAQVHEVMEKCNVADVGYRIIGHLSKGYKQRVGLAQALLNEPQVLVLDEPTIGLDPSQRSEVLDLIRGLGGERTVILSTHILHDVERVCTKVVVINRGHLQFAGPLQRLQAEVAGSGSVRLEVAGPSDLLVSDAIKDLPDVLEVEVTAVDGPAVRLRVQCRPGRDLRPHLAALVVGKGWDLLEMTSAKNLDDAFTQIIKSEEPVVASNLSAP